MTREETLTVPIKKALESGIFNIQMGSIEFGCIGIICHARTQNGALEFYFNKDTLDCGLTPEQYIENRGIDKIAYDIANTIINEMAETTEFIPEAILYLFTLHNIETDIKIKEEILNIIDEIYIKTKFSEEEPT